MFDLLLTNATVATMADDFPFGLVRDGAIGIADGKIAWVGPAAQSPQGARTVRDLAGKVVTPGLVDPHTHIVYGEEGLVDFEVLSQGGQRWDLEPKGGGVGALTRRTRLLSEEVLYAASRARMSRLIANGVTTVESKSGAGLDRDTELRLMRISRALGRDLPITVVSTYLGAHGLAPEYAGRRDDYVDFMCNEVLPEAVRQGVVDQVDGFCDKVGFSHAQMDRLFDKAASYGLRVKLHADQYTDFGAGAVVARHRGVSADHLEYASRATVQAMAEAGTVATLLPGAHLTLHETQKPPVETFRELGVPMALATNSNPVSSPTVSPVGADASWLLPVPPDARGGIARLHRERRARPWSRRQRRAHRGGPRGRPRGVGHRRPARHRLCDRRHAVPRRRQERRRRPRGSAAGVRASMTGPDKLLHWLDAERESQLDFLQRFARIDTANPPGDTRRAADLFRAFLDREGIAHRTEAPQAAHPNLIATFEGGAGGGRHLVLNGHLDVFPVGDRAAWARDPWSGEIVDGRVHGRGTVDMKCGTTALLFVFAYLYRLRSRAARPRHAHRGVGRGDRRQMGHRLADREQAPRRCWATAC